MIWAKKSLGQNFLISPRIVDMIAAAGDIRPGEPVLEIGPGKGVLTKALLAKGATVIAVEKDDRLIPLLKGIFDAEIRNGHLELVHADILEAEQVQIPALDQGSYTVIANIPYYITGQIIRTFLSRTNKPRRMVLMVQKEVATRIAARDNKESILSLAVKAYAKPELIVNVARGNFFPIPNVDSAVIALSDIHSPFADSAEEQKFFDIVKSGFAQKRKKLSRNLEAVAEKATIEKAFEKLGLDLGVRAEDVALAIWIALAKEL